MLSKINESKRYIHNKVICCVFVVFGMFAKIAPALASKIRDQERYKVKEQIENLNFSRMKFDSFLHAHKPESVGVHPWSSNELDEKLNPRFTSFFDNMDELVLPEKQLAGYEFHRERAFGRIYDIGDVKFTHGLYTFNDASHPALILNNPSAYGLTHNWADIKDLFESNSQRNVYHPYIGNIQDFEYVYDWSERLSISLKARNVFNHLYSTENPFEIGIGSWSSMLRLSLQ